MSQTVEKWIEKYKAIGLEIMAWQLDREENIAREKGFFILNKDTKWQKTILKKWDGEWDKKMQEDYFDRWGGVITEMNTNCYNFLVKTVGSYDLEFNVLEVSTEAQIDSLLGIKKRHWLIYNQDDLRIYYKDGQFYNNKSEKGILSKGLQKESKPRLLWDKGEQLCKLCLNESEIVLLADRFGIKTPQAFWRNATKDHKSDLVQRFKVYFVTEGIVFDAKALQESLYVKNTEGYHLIAR